MSLRRKRGKGKDQRVAEAGAEAEDEDEDEDDIWTPEVYVYLLVGGHEVRATVNVIFDTGSLENIISTSCLREGFHGFAYSRSVGRRVAEHSHDRYQMERTQQQGTTTQHWAKLPIPCRNVNLSRRGIR
jgi:hypothetical protein